MSLKILHTADWHLGRSLHGFDLTPAFEYWIDFLVQTVKAERVDAVIVAGDVFDRGIAPAPMLELLSHALDQLLAHTQVILISGNHDSASRLGFGSQFMQTGLHIRTRNLDCATPISLTNRDGEIAALIYAIPYLNPELAKAQFTAAALSDSSPTTPDLDTPTTPKANVDSGLTAHSGSVMSHAMQLIQHDITHGKYHELDVPILVVAHDFLVGAELSQSETAPQVGGLASVSAQIFQLPTQIGKQINYVALGHIHRPQTLTSKPTVKGQIPPIVRYSGSPLPFDFAEYQQEKSVTIVELPTTNHGSTSYRTLGIPPWKPLKILTGSFTDFMEQKFANQSHCFVYARITDTERPLNLQQHLKQLFPFLLRTEMLSETKTITDPLLQHLKYDPLQALQQFFTESGGRDLTPGEEKLISQIWQKIGDADCVNESKPTEPTCIGDDNHAS